MHSQWLQRDHNCVITLKRSICVFTGPENRKNVYIKVRILLMFAFSLYPKTGEYRCAVR